MVQSIDDKSNVFAHITVNVIGLGEKFRCLIDKIRGQYSGDDAVIIGLIKFLQSVRKKTECSRSENSVCLSALQFRSYVNDAVAG